MDHVVDVDSCCWYLVVVTRAGDLVSRVASSPVSGRGQAASSLLMEFGSCCSESPDKELKG